MERSTDGRSGSDRRTFLRRAGLAAVGGGLLAVGCGGDGASEEGDLGLLNLLLTMEHVAADLYRRGLDAGLLSGRDRALAETVAQHERDHVEVLRLTIEDMGGVAAQQPDIVHPEGLFSDVDRFLERAARLEELEVGAYQGRILEITDPGALETVASIAGTESRHAAVIARLGRRGPFPAPVERPTTEGGVRDAIATLRGA